MWIEIRATSVVLKSPMSLPLRECGLKFLPIPLSYLILFVTPLAGVWIEIMSDHRPLTRRIVTPLAGVWIEIIKS